ncbi:Piso0_003548 [Millerozyma farinosa CBS 7064]|uniref:Piso0_003548 protein n=1 Tax=Pichia sorbitophila (strain ATCC MYA-4447 / BCRC 22081 / CBS 7064 / NBRC 10061 / NRRL Y-12695) TaxID=559304 RepID=G8YJD7_PICSO|nr:Piso0_003548 [Millerozyma farinosa CBS 7064]CCE81197.1 Piso0_003548 [Millerozyma farinosa CBS 7064]
MHALYYGALYEIFCLSDHCVSSSGPEVCVCQPTAFDVLLVYHRYERYALGIFKRKKATIRPELKNGIKKDIVMKKALHEIVTRQTNYGVITSKK